MTAKHRNNAVDVAIGARIRARRQDLSLSQTALSRRLGMSYQQLQRYEWGDHALVIGKLMDLADALATSVTWLVGEADGHPPALGAPMTQREATTLLAAYQRIEREDDRGLVLRLAEALCRPEPDWPDEI